MNSINTALSSLRRRWDALLAIGTMIPNPGFLGPVPYLLLIRMLMLIWVLSAFAMAKGGSRSGAMPILMVLAGVHGILSITYSLPRLRYSVHAQHVTILLDITFISWAYAISGNIETDFYLFYFLPIFAAAEYFRAKQALAYLGLVALVFALTMFWMMPRSLATSQATSLGAVFLATFAPRELAFSLVGLVFLSAFRLRRSLYNLRNHELAPLLSHNPLELNLKVDAMLETITLGLGFQYATLSLVNRYKHEIRTVRWKNLAMLWLGEWPHGLDDADIQAEVVRTGKPVSVIGWHKLFDPEIYYRFGHDRLARIFVPVSFAGKVIGTIEAGREKGDPERPISDGVRIEIENLAMSHAETIAQLRPESLLELAAERVGAFLGADSATLHLFQGRESHPYMEGSWGKVDPVFLHKHPFSEGSVGHSAWESRNLQILDDENSVRSKSHPLHALGVKAMAAFPMDLGDSLSGVLCVYYFRHYRFTRTDWELEQFLTKPLQLAIKQNTLSRTLTESHQGAVAFARFQNLIQSLSGRMTLPEFLEELCETVLYMLNPDNVVLYQYVRDRAYFETPPIMEGRFRNTEAMGKPIKEGDLVWTLIQDGKSVFAPEVVKEPKLSGRKSEDLGGPGFSQREGILSCAALVLRDDKSPDGEPVGLLFINYRQHHNFTPHEKETMNALASSAAVAIKSMRLQEEVRRNLERRKKEEEAFHEIDEFLSRPLAAMEIEDVGELILSKALGLTHAFAGDFMWLNRISGKLETKAYKGSEGKTKLAEMETTVGIIGKAARDAESQLAQDVRNPKSKYAAIYLDQEPLTQCELAVPLLGENKELLGVLNVEHQDPFGLDEEDQRILESFAIQARIAWHSIQMRRKLEFQVDVLVALRTITPRMSKFGMDKALRLILTGVTSGAGLGFSRAMVFLIDESNGVLEGRMAIGAQTKQEAESNWASQEDDEKGRGSPRQERIVRQIEALSRDIESGRISDSPLGTAVRSVRLPLSQIPDGALKKALTSKKTVPLAHNESDSFRRILEHVSRGDPGSALAIVPIQSWEDEPPLGVLVADYRFLFKEQIIEEDDLELLRQFSSLIVMAVKMVRELERNLRDKEIHVQKKATENVTKKINSRITAIDMSIWILNTALEDTKLNLSQGLANKVNIVKESVQKAKTEMALLSRYFSARYFHASRFDLAALVLQASQQGSRRFGFAIECKVPPDPFFLFGNPDRIRDCLFRLFKNSVEAMGRSDRRPKISMSLSEFPESDSQQPSARIDILDNGPGVEDGRKQVIFEVCSSSDPNNAGMGLSIVREVIEAHRGVIEEIGKFGDGAHFVIKLPVDGVSPESVYLEEMADDL